MTLKFYGMSVSPSAQRVLMTFAELGVTDFEFIEINVMKGEHKQPSYLAIHPWGKIPLLDDDGYLLYESRAICRYLCLKYAEKNTKGLMPSPADLKAYGHFEQACSLEQICFDEPTQALWYEKQIKGLKGLGSANEAMVKQYVTAIDENLGVYEQILSKQKYLAGDLFTLADLFHIPHVDRMYNEWGCADVMNKYPTVADWSRRIQNRDSWKGAAAEAEAWVKKNMKM